jgi:branched-chain amino acid aminotransferase
LLETSSLPEQIYSLNNTGLKINVYKDARKACDNFSHIKSNNYLCYAMAALWVRNNNLNDALILNSFNRIADATIANVFIVKDGIIKTPPLQEGCIAGVMRRYLIKCFFEANLPLEETQLTLEDVLQASEVFLTNAIQGLKWVRSCGDSNYTSHLCSHLYNNFVRNLSFY